jgi:hypothetical protein
MITLRVKVTSDVLEKSKYYGVKIDREIPEDCAIMLAIRNLFPEALVGYDSFQPFEDEETTLDLPDNARKFIKEFERFSPEKRTLMNEFEFEIEIPETVYSKVDLDEIKPLLINHSSLQFV